MATVGPVRSRRSYCWEAAVRIQYTTNSTHQTVHQTVNQTVTFVNRQLIATIVSLIAISRQSNKYNHNDITIVLILLKTKDLIHTERFPIRIYLGINCISQVVYDYGCGEYKALTFSVHLNSNSLIFVALQDYLFKLFFISPPPQFGSLVIKDCMASSENSCRKNKHSNWKNMTFRLKNLSVKCF